MANRLIIANNGPAEARNIKAEFADVTTNEPWTFVTTTGDPFPIPLLAAGDHFHVVAFVTMSGTYYVKLTLTWEDKRRGVQKRETTLSTLGVPLGGESGRVAIERFLEDLVRGMRSR